MLGSGNRSGDERTTDVEQSSDSTGDDESNFGGDVAGSSRELQDDYEAAGSEIDDGSSTEGTSHPSPSSEQENNGVNPNLRWKKNDEKTTDLMVEKIPGYLPLNSSVLVPVTMSSRDLYILCERRTSSLKSKNEIFAESMNPYQLPDPPVRRSYTPEVMLDIPVINISSLEMVAGNELKTLCENSTLVLIRNMTSILSMDLDVFTTESMLEFPSHDVELRLQLMPSSSEFNCDTNGKPTWRYQSIPDHTTLERYADYQSQLRQKYLKSLSSDSNLADAENRIGGKVGTEKRQSSGRGKRAQAIKFGTNVDLADKNKFRKQLNELLKLPPFLRIEDRGNMLSYLGYDIAGVNTVQFYMKVKGVRTPGHLENNCLASVNINIGPDDCEWYGVDYAYLSAINKLVERNKLRFLHDSWWPNYHELLQAGIPVYRFVQKYGDIVWVGSGCIHWVESSGFCNNVAWNVGPLTTKQYMAVVNSYMWNMNQKYMSVVPVQHLSWRLAQHVEILDRQLYVLIRLMLIRSLAFCKIIANVVSGYKEIRRHPHYDGDAALFCVQCELEVWNLFFAKYNDGKYDVYCFNCARKNGLRSFVFLQQYTFEDLSVILDNFTLRERY